jgi:hypothetical protein
LDLIKGISIDDRMVLVDYQIAETDLQHKFELNKLVEKIRFVVKEWNSTKAKSVYIAPYFCFIQSSGIGKIKFTVSSAIWNYNIQTDLLTDELLEKESPSREGNEIFYPRGSKILFDPFFR